MQSAYWRRALLLFALLTALGGSLGILRANLLQARATPIAAPPNSCPSYRTSPDLIVIFPTAPPHSSDTLSLDLPGPILVVPPACP